MPANVLRTSDRLGFFERYPLAVSRMKSISSRERPWLERRLPHRRVRGAHHGVPVPRDREHHARVACARHHDRRLAAEEALVQDHVDALAGRDHRQGDGIVQAPHAVAESAGRVDQRACLDHVLAAGLEVAKASPTHVASVVLVQVDDRRVVDQAGALLGGRPRQVDQQTAVVELPVVVLHAPAQALLLERRDALEHLLARQDPRAGEAVAAGQHVVDAHADAVEGRLPPQVVGHDEREVADEVRRVLQQQPPLVERLHHERHVALLQVAHAAVHQLRRPARGPLAEVALLEQQHLVAARGGVHRHADAGGAASDHEHVPRIRVVAHPLEHLVPVHAGAMIRCMLGLLKPATEAPRLPPERIDPEYRRLRRQVFVGIFAGYAAYYLVRNTLALAIPDLLREYPQYSKAMLGTAMTGLSIAYGLSKFLMGSVSDRSNPKYFLPLGLLLSAGIIFVSGTLKAIYASLALVVLLQTVNGWVQGMGWPPCGKSMVHWWSTRERGLTVATWNVAHNVGGALVANFALLGVTLFGDWGAKFYFNALIAAAIAIVVFFLLRDTPQSCGLPPVEEYKNDYPPTTARTTSGSSVSARSSSATSSRTATCGRSPWPTPSSTSSATAS